MKQIALIVSLLIIGPILGAEQCRAQEPFCIITVDPRIIYMEAEGGKEEVTVTPSGPECAFAPRTAYIWIKAYFSEGAGRRVVVIEVDPAPNLAQRVGSVMIGTTQVEIVQKARDHLNW